MHNIYQTIVKTSNLSEIKAMLTANLDPVSRFFFGQSTPAYFEALPLSFLKVRPKKTGGCVNSLR